MVYVYEKCRAITVADFHKPYKDEVVRQLDLIATTDVGVVLYRFLAKAKWRVRIDWRLGQHWARTATSEIAPQDLERIARAAEKNERERGLDADQAFDAAVKEDLPLQNKLHGIFSKDHPLMRSVDLDFLKWFGLPTHFNVPTEEKGTGVGADVNLAYHPAAFREIMKNAGGAVPMGFGPAEVLYHELVHAQRMIAGAILRENVPQAWGMDDFEEFCAIVAANMYRSARGFKSLRFDHQPANEKAPWRGNTVLPPELADSKKYFERFKPQFVKWFNNQRDFCLALAASKAPFNPMKVAAAQLGFSVP
jgi:hypothetical protein